MTKNFGDLMKAAKSKLNAGQQRVKKPADGKTVWRILPSTDDENPGAFYRVFGQHWIKDQSGKLQTVVVCEDITFDKPCPVCSAMHKAKMASPDKETTDALDESYPKRTYLMNAVYLEGPDADQQVHVLEVGKKVMDGILNIAENLYSDEEVVFVDPKEGVDIIINRSGKGLQTAYTVSGRSQKASKPVSASAMLGRIDLEAFVSDESESKKAKAIATLESMTASAGLMARPMKSITEVLGGDSVPEYTSDASAIGSDEDDVYVPKSERAAKAAPVDVVDVSAASDEDIDAMLAKMGA